METKSRIGDGKFRVPTIDCVTSETRPVAKILSVGSTIWTLSIRPTEPWNTHSVADGESFNTIGNLLDVPDDLVPGNQRQLGIGQFAIDHMKIRPANCACGDTHKQLSLRRFWLWHIAQLQRVLRLFQNHRAHVSEYKMTNDE